MAFPALRGNFQHKVTTKTIKNQTGKGFLVKWPVQYTSPVIVRDHSPEYTDQDHNSFPNIVQKANGDMVCFYLQSNAHGEFSSADYGNLAYNVSAATMQSTIEQITTVGTGNVSVSLAGSVYTITFQGSLANKQYSNVAYQPTYSALTGGTSPSVTVTNTQVGDATHNSIWTATINGSPTGGYFNLGFGGYPHKLARKVSTDGGATWGTESIVVDDTTTHPGGAWSSYTQGFYGYKIRKFADESLFMTYYTHVPGRPDVTESWYRTSTDYGVTWSTRTKITSWYGVDYMASHDIYIEGNRAWVTMYGIDSGVYSDNAPYYNAYSKFGYTDDKGATWTVVSSIPTSSTVNGGHNCQNGEASLTRLDDGRWLTMMRVEGTTPQRFQAYSSDDMVTWTTPTQCVGFTGAQNVCITNLGTDGELMTFYAQSGTAKVSFSRNYGALWEGTLSLPVVTTGINAALSADWVNIGARGANGNIGITWAYESNYGGSFAGQTVAEVYFTTLTAMQPSIPIQRQYGLARLQYVTLKTQTGITRVTAITPRTQTGIASVANVVTRDQIGLSRIALVTTKTQAGISRITAVITQTISGIADIATATPQTQTGISRVTITTSRTQSGISGITSTTLQTQTGIASITVTTLRTQTGISDVQRTTLQTQIGISRIALITGQTITGISRITITTPQVQTGISRITATTTRIQSGISRITVVTPRTQTGISRVTTVVARTQTGIADILVATNKPQIGLATIGTSVVKGQAGKSRIQVTTTSTQVGKARITVTTSQSQTGKAHIAAAETGNLKYLFAGVVYDALLDEIRTSKVKLASVPTSASDTGKRGQVAIDTGYIYICVATNTWVRAALSTW